MGGSAVHSTIGLGRAHIAPLLGTFSTLHPGVDIELDLSHLPLNIAGTSFDIAIRVGQLRDSRLKARRLHPNRRVLCAAPSYFNDRTRPTSLADLADHHCIVIRENETDYAIWRFGKDDDETAVRVHGSMISNDGDIATRWCLEGHGLIMRSLWQVAPFMRDGALELGAPRHTHPGGRHLCPLPLSQSPTPPHPGRARPPQNGPDSALGLTGSSAEAQGPARPMSNGSPIDQPRTTTPPATGVYMPRRPATPAR